MKFIISEYATLNWDRWLDELTGNIYHSKEWAEICTSVYSRPLFFYWTDDEDRCMGMAVGIKTWSPIRYIGHISRRLDFETCPVVRGNDPQLAELAIQNIVDFTKRNGYRSLSIDSQYSNIYLSNMDKLGFTITPRVEFRLALSENKDILWKQMAEHHRRKIKKAEKHGMTFMESSTIDALMQGKQLQGNSRDRRIKRGEDIGTLDDSYYEEMGKRYFDRNIGRVYLMNYNDRPVSTAFISMYAKRALYVYGGSNDEGFHLDAPALLFWNIFLRCQELGYTEFNMGGVPAYAIKQESQSYGLYRFKVGFGGRQVECLSGSMENLNPYLRVLSTIREKGHILWKF